MPVQLQLNLSMILLSIGINIIKISYDAVLYQLFKSMTEFDDVIEF